MNDHDHLVARLKDMSDLSGPAALDGVLERFAQTLQDMIGPDGALAPCDSAQAHRVVGLAGLLGFRQLERVFRRIEDDPEPLGPRQRAARLIGEALAFLRHRRA